MLLLGIVIIQYNIEKKRSRKRGFFVCYIYMKYMNFIKVEIQCFITLFEFFYCISLLKIMSHFISFRKKL